MAMKCEYEISLIFLAWHKFIKTGKIDPAAVRPEVAESWIRCYNTGVDPLTTRSRRMLDKPQLDELLERKKYLIDVARPFMTNLYSFVANSNFVVLLCDEHGYIMETVGDSNDIKNAPELNFCRGALWTEEEIGNNGAGTSLVLKRPFQVSGPEHYCRKHHPWTCSGAPIFDDDNRIIGILEMSGPVEETHLHTLGMVVAAVEAIRQQMRNQKKNRELTLLNNHLNNIFLTVSDGVIVVDLQGVIRQINPVAEKILNKTPRDIEGRSITNIFERCKPIKNMLGSGRAFTDLELTVNTDAGSVYTFASGKPIKDDRGHINGGVIFINPINKIKKLINRFNGAQATFHFKDIVGNSKPLLKAMQLAVLASSNNSNVLLNGESGTGKEIFAQSIHNRSKRHNGPFIAVNCGAIPRELIGSELFGYVEGAFTGAQKGGRPGKFELASGGTLFLDEIGDMPLEQQVSLLRVLQDKTITRIGGDKPTVVDVRIICATNKNLLLEIAKGNFRQDIYYRLNVINITLPPLRERREDIPLMFNVFFEKACRKLGISVPRVNPEVIKRLRQYDWPGNAREFQNVVERMVNIATGQQINIEHLPEEILSPRPITRQSKTTSQVITIIDEKKKIKEMLAEKERQEIYYFLSKSNGNLSQVARDMGISRNSLYRKLKKLNIMP
ncbi:PAS domain S-box-containing protein [Desulfotomaculum arcticum]|uniref:PAS domain S-box-containing protein n=1 Tax=Desulfotruncus arcticus DSM 17038 TaxID=1121424 RepID=A0A1I2X9G0_9FIRM|nr:sigma-54-dependent Fis family transcriptional regulator [Desulfotruncus arcticus]SFH10042.1 PAS domain S-box-containing protein [Desulfotomaculum arcticum] [Desulfotruncus arcticus DSM 17038]